MRQLRPIDRGPTELRSINDKPITQAQYEELVGLVNQYHEDLETTIGNFDQWKSDIQTAFASCTLTANQLNAITADICSILANEFRAECICGATCINTPQLNTTCICADNIKVDNNVSANGVSACNGQFTSAAIDNLTACCLSVTCPMTFDIINATTVCTTNAEITNATVLNGDFDCICADNADICGLNINCACITDESVANSNTTCARIQWLDNTWKTHCQMCSIVTDPDDFYITIPKFLNGEFRVTAVVAGQVKWDLEALNSSNNYLVRWSDPYNMMRDMYVYNVACPESQLYVHAVNCDPIVCLYFSSDAFDTVCPIETQNQWPIPTTSSGAKYYEFNQRYGNWFSRNIITPTSAAEPLMITPMSCYECTCDESDPMYYDLSAEVNYPIYRPDQEVNKNSSVEFNQVWAKDIYDPEDPSVLLSEGLVDTPNLSVTCTALMPHTTIMDGEPSNVEAVCNGLLVDCNGIYRKSTDSDTCAHLNEVAVLTDDPLVDLTCGLIKYDANTHSLTSTTCAELENLEVDNLQVNCNANINGCLSVQCDVTINGDLRVAGTTYTTCEETLSTNSDNIVLRQNASQGLANGEYSGIIVNKYNGTSSLALVSDNTGTARVGTSVGSDTTYADIYLAANKWYTDAELTTEVQPAGDLMSWDSAEETVDYVHYVNAIFTAFNYTSAEPIATRDEVSNMCDGAPTVWDASCTRLVTNAASNGDQKFVTVYYDPSDPTCGFCYAWVNDVPKAVLCCYATCADYLADVANICAGYQVVIMDETSYVEGEDR